MRHCTMYFLWSHSIVELIHRHTSHLGIAVMMMIVCVVSIGPVGAVAVVVVVIVSLKEPSAGPSSVAVVLHSIATVPLHTFR